MLKLGLLRIPQGYLSLQVGNQLEAQFTETLEDVVYCGYNCRSSHVGEGITMVQNRGARILMSGKESTWCKIEAPEFSCQGRNQHGANRGGRDSHVSEGINMVQHRKDPEIFLCAEHIQKR
jgi:hypothetical protein